MLHHRPQYGQRRCDVSAKEYRQIVLVRHAERIVELGHQPDVTEYAPEHSGISSNAKDDATVESARTPEEIFVVPAQRGRQPVLRSEEIQRCGFAVVTRVD